MNLVLNSFSVSPIYVSWLFEVVSVTVALYTTHLVRHLPYIYTQALLQSTMKLTYCMSVKKKVKNQENVMEKRKLFHSKVGLDRKSRKKRNFLCVERPNKYLGALITSMEKRTMRLNHAKHT